MNNQFLTKHLLGVLCQCWDTKNDLYTLYIFFKKAQNNDCATSQLNRKVISLNV